MFIIYTIVFWVSICFLFGAGYDTARYIKEARVAFKDFDRSEASTALRTMVTKAFEKEMMPSLVDLTDSTQHMTQEAAKQAVFEGDWWAAAYIKKGFGDQLQRAIAEGAEYDPQQQLVLVTEESRHYLKVQVVTKTMQGGMAAIQAPFARLVFEQAVRQAGGNAATVIDSANPVALVSPFIPRVVNVAPYHFDLSLYILSVTLSMGMVVGAFIPSNMWKTIEEPFYRQVRVGQVILLRSFVNLVWAAVICVQITGIMFAFRGPSWSPTVGDFFGIFGIILLNTLAFSFFIDCLQNWIHPRFLLAAYFMTLFVNISAALFGTELNNHFFRVLYATPFLATGFSLRTLLTDGSYNKSGFAVTVPLVWMVLWWVLSTWLIARKTRLVREGKLLMANIPPPPSPATEKPGAKAGAAAVPAPPPEAEISEEMSLNDGEEDKRSSISPPSSSAESSRRSYRESVSDIEIEDM